MFFYSELVEISNIILTSFILFILLYFSYWILFIIITFLFQLYYWFKVKNKELSQIYSITEYMILYIYIYIWMIFFFFFELWFICMILDNMIMFWLWYLANGGYLLVPKLILFGDIMGLSYFWTQLMEDIH